MFRAHRPIFRRVRTAVHTTIGSVSSDYSHQDRPQHTEHASRAVQILNQWLCEQLYEFSCRWACGPETCRDPAIYEQNSDISWFSFHILQLLIQCIFIRLFPFKKPTKRTRGLYTWSVLDYNLSLLLTCFGL